MVTGTRDGWIYAWHTEGTESSIIEWESFHHDNHNSGNLETPLDLAKHKAKTPLVEVMCKAPVTEPPVVIEAKGGCNYTVGDERSSSQGGLAMVGLLGLGLSLARRRRR